MDQKSKNDDTNGLNFYQMTLGKINNSFFSQKLKNN